MQVIVIYYQGGFYESLIEQVKTAPRTSIGGQTMTWKEMATDFISEVESLLNSRPIGYSPYDANDFRPLTPNHSMIGRASTYRCSAGSV